MDTTSCWAHQGLGSCRELGCSPCSGPLCLAPPEHLAPLWVHREGLESRGTWVSPCRDAGAAGMPGEMQAHVRARLHLPGETNVLF